MVPEWPTPGKTGGRLTRLEPADEWTNKLKRVECIHGGGRFVAAYTVAGRNVLALQLEDHGGATGFDLMITSNDAATNPIFSINPPAAAVPEPASLILLATGLVGSKMRRGRG